MPRSSHCFLMLSSGLFFSTNSVRSLTDRVVSTFLAGSPPRRSNARSWRAARRAGAKNPHYRPFPGRLRRRCWPLGDGFLPVGNLHRVDVKILGDRLDGLNALERLMRHAGFNSGSCRLRFTFILCDLGWVKAPPPTTRIIA